MARAKKDSPVANREETHDSGPPGVRFLLGSCVSRVCGHVNSIVNAWSCSVEVIVRQTFLDAVQIWMSGLSSMCSTVWSVQHVFNSLDARGQYPHEQEE